MRYPASRLTVPFKQFPLVIGTVLLLASCASFNGIGSAARTRTPADYATAASLPAQGGQWPNLSWADSIGGAPLQALVDEALAGNPGLQTAAARVAAARAAAEAAGAAREPGIAANFKSTYQRYTENGIIPPPLAGQYKLDNELTLDFSYDFDFWGRHAAALRAALSQGKAAEAEQYTSRLVLTTSIARAWVQLARQYAQLDLVEQQLIVRQKIDRLTQLRFAAGLDPQTENQQARQQLSGLRAEQTQWQESIALTRNQLAALMGQGPDRGQRIARPNLPEEAALPLPDELPLTLLGRRPDIVAARWRVEAAQGDIDAAKAQFYPNVNLMAFAGFSSLGLPELLQSGSRVVGIGPAISVPLFQSGGLRAQLKGRVAGYDAAVATYNQALTDALHDVADQVQSLRAAEIQSGHQGAATQAAAGSLKLAQQRERVGTTNMLPVLSTEMALLAQRKVELDARARRTDLRIALIKALGGGFDASAQGLEPAAGAAMLSNPSNNRSTSAKSAS
ncbi:MAG: putative efflux system outer rane lipoprotein NodT [Herminiimonas sp.]|nr:putative efflux system outer rane lipoprotein NodT [Herminiimonas sp.]